VSASHTKKVMGWRRQGGSPRTVAWQRYRWHGGLRLNEDLLLDLLTRKKGGQSELVLAVAKMG
jgi:hypothetical protein